MQAVKDPVNWLVTKNTTVGLLKAEGHVPFMCQ